MKKLCVLASFFLVPIAHADINKKMDELCDKAKTCSLEQMGDVPPEMEDMVTGMIQGMCKPLMAPYAKTVGDAGLEEKASTCIDSVVALSCDDMMKGQEQAQTQECKDFEKAADEAGVDLSQ